MLSAVVLSGGSGTRMGSEKGLLMFRGMPLVARVVDAMSSVADEVVVSVAPGMSSAYRSALGDAPVLVEDRHQGVGPLEGLTTSFAVAKGGLVATSPCDTPFLRAELVTAVVESIGDADIAVPSVGGLLEPLHAAYRRDTCRDAFERALAKGEHKIVSAYSGLRVSPVDERKLRAADPGLRSFVNLNSRDELVMAEAEVPDR
jgi:molybdopterin-guanine dinucleotide biosynthesis protein A